MEEFRLVFRKGPLPKFNLEKLNWLRQNAREAGLIGDDPSRYPAPYGNASIRLESPGRIRFAVTGTKTSGLPELTASHVSVIEYDPGRRLFTASGPCKPTSEYILHGTVYLLDPSAGAVLHSHCPALWNAASRLGIPSTRRGIDTKTAELAAEIERLFRETNVREKRIFSIPAHRDGIVSFGRTPREAWSVTSGFLERVGRELK